MIIRVAVTNPRGAKPMTGSVVRYELQTPLEPQVMSLGSDPDRVRLTATIYEQDGRKLALDVSKQAFGQMLRLMREFAAAHEIKEQ